jgi:hypothetical protein
LNWSANGSFVPTEVEKARRGPTRIAREISRIYPAQHFGGVIFLRNGTGPEWGSYDARRPAGWRQPTRRGSSKRDFGYVSPWRKQLPPSVNRLPHQCRNPVLRDQGECSIQRPFYAQPNLGCLLWAHIRSSIGSRVCVEISASSGSEHIAGSPLYAAEHQPRAKRSDADGIS